MDDHNKIFGDFIKDNPAFAAGKHRQLADWHYDTKLRDAVDKGEMKFADALTAARDHALELLPIQQKRETTLSAHDTAIRNIAIARNQEPPTPSGRKDEEPLSEIAQICAQRAGLTNT
jgi:hypothetical protein